MKYLRRSLFLGSALLMSIASNANAHDGTVNISGTITDNTCTVSPDSKDFTVTMGNVASKQFYQAGDGTRYEPFTIHLEKCGGAANGVTVAFSGTKDSRNTDLLAIPSGTGVASGMGIGIYNQDKSLIPVGSDSVQTKLTPNQASVSIVFYARYIADGGAVTAGTANASATFTLTYA